MAVSFARPNVSELVFHVLGRSVHPELFTFHTRAETQHEAYSAVMQISDAGHVLSFRHQDQIVTEVTATRQALLPRRKRLLTHRLSGHRSESVLFESGLRYQVSFQLEQLEPEEFHHFHQELLTDCNRCQISHRFETSNRLCPVPLSFIQTEDTPRSLLVHAFHTFPENFAVVKIQSLFEV